MVNVIFEVLYFVLLVAGPLPLTHFLLCLSSDPRNPKSSVSHQLLSIVIGWFCLQTLVGLLLGIFGGLNRSLLIGTEVFLLSMGLILIYQNHPSWSLSSLYIPLVSLSWLEKMALMLLTLVGLTCWVNAAQEPITNFDSLYYHLPMATHFYQTGSLARLEEFAQISYYPYHWEIIASLFLFPFRNDFQVVFPNLIAFATWMLAIYCLSRQLGAERLAAIISSGFASLLPLLITQINTLHVDLAFAALFMAALYLLIHFLQSGQPSSLLLLLLVTGLLTGIKMSAFGYIGGLSITAAFWLKNQLGCPKSIWLDRKYRLFLVAGIAGFLFLSSYWYLANWAQTGNPLGLINVRLGPVTFFYGNQDFDQYLNLIYPHFSGLQPFADTFYGAPSNFDELAHRTSMLYVFDLASQADWATLFKQIWQQCGIPGLILLIGSFLSIAKLRKGSTHVLQLGFLGILAITLLLYWLTPYSGDNGSQGWRVTDWIGQGFRYGLPTIGVMAALAAFGMQKSRRIPGLLLILLAGFSIKLLIILINNSLLLLILVLLTSMLLAVGLFFIKWVRWTAIQITIWAALPFILLLSMPFLLQERESRRLRQFNELEVFLQGHTQPGEQVGYLISFFSYPLYTGELNRSVVFAAAPTDNLEDWLTDLRQQKIHLVAIGPYRYSVWEETREYRWLNDPQGSFNQVFGIDSRTGFVLFRLKE